MQGEYDWVLVALSYGVSVLGAVTALQLAIDIPLARGPGRRLAAVLASALAMGGGGIWAMHFIAMLRPRHGQLWLLRSRLHSRMLCSSVLLSHAEICCVE